MKNTRRRRFRFKPDPAATAVIVLEDRSSGKKIAGLIENESYSGCCLVTLLEASSQIKFDRIYRIRISDKLELRAEVRWLKRLDNVAVQIGFEYVD